MVMYNFHRSFAGLVAAQWKNQTIRCYRNAPSRHAAIGEPVQLWTGARSKNAVKLRSPDPECIDNAQVVLFPSSVLIDGQRQDDLELFAMRDGFASWAELVRFFELKPGRGPTIMRLIKWAPGDVIGSEDDFRAAQKAAKTFEQVY